MSALDNIAIPVLLSAVGVLSSVASSTAVTKAPRWMHPVDEVAVLMSTLSYTIGFSLR